MAEPYWPCPCACHWPDAVLVNGDACCSAPGRKADAPKMADRLEELEARRAARQVLDDHFERATGQAGSGLSDYVLRLRKAHQPIIADGIYQGCTCDTILCGGKDLLLFWIEEFRAAYEAKVQDFAAETLRADEAVGEVRRLREALEAAQDEMVDILQPLVSYLIDHHADEYAGNHCVDVAITLVGRLRVEVETLKRDVQEPLVDKGDLIALDELDINYCGWGDCRNANVVALRWAGIEHGFLPVCTRHMMERVVGVQVANDVLGEPDV